MREILLLHCVELVCPRVLSYVFQELTHAFVERGYTVRNINNLEELHNDSIVFVGDIIRIPNIIQRLNYIAPDAVYVAWYWGESKLGKKNRSSDLRYLLHIHENFLDKRALPSHVEYFEEIAKLTNTAPLLLRAREKPENIGVYPRIEKWDYCYMGWVYCPELVPTDKNYRGLYHAVTDHSKYLSYETRREVYLRSVCALGFQSAENLRSKHVSQRIYEGMAYGCIVLTNSYAAVEQTDGIAILVHTKNEVQDLIDFYKTHPVERQQKKEEGYNFIRTKQGTNHDSIDVLLHKIQECYGIV